MRLLGLDIETTGLSHDEDRITELAWTIKDHGDPKPYVMRSFFILPEAGAAPLAPAITELTGICPKHLDYGLMLDMVLSFLDSDLRTYKVDAVVAHNGEGFDKPFLKAQAQRLVLKDADHLMVLPWIDTSVDVVYPAACRATSLLYVAAYHKFLNPFSHAALFDVMTMLKVLDLYEIKPVLLRALSPWCFVAADVGFDNRQLAKDRRYHWETFGEKRFPKTWVKRIKEMDLEKERAEAPFAVHKL